MSVRVGVDVGGTFTKAVACDAATGRVVARAVYPTTHESRLGVAEGVVRAIERVSDDVGTSGLGPVSVVSHSTTQAVNALLEGDTATVGVLGVGRRPDLRKAHRRTQVGDIRLAPGRSLTTVHAFLDGTEGLDRAAVRSAVSELQERGAAVVCASEAFGVDEPAGEHLVLEVARELGLPACAGHELTGLYGLELRTVTGALNASILPTALKMAGIVESAVAAGDSSPPLLVMRGDGGAAGLGSMRRHPLLTAFSGPAASVVGALRHLALHDGVVIEVGGTSTNVSMIRGGRPVLAYVRVLDHVTSVRSLDVRVMGVAGGSLMRIGRRFGRPRIEEVGPRSAHIAGLNYCSFATEAELAGARVRLISPRPGDPAEYAVIENAAGTRFALTPTCAANALGTIPTGAYARGNAGAARSGFAALGEWLGIDPRAAARRTLELTSDKIVGAVSEAVRDAGLVAPQVVGLGGGAGAVVPEVAGRLGLEWRIPADAEVISSIGDALSLVRVEIEKTMGRASAPAEITRLHRAAEDAAIAAGAAPASLQVESEAVPERGAVRVVATGSVALETGVALEERVSEEDARRLAKAELEADPELISANGYFYVFALPGPARRRFAVIDQHGALALSGSGLVISGTGESVAEALQRQMPAMVRHIGPVSIAPSLRVLRATRLVDLSLLSIPRRALEAARAECALAGSDGVVAFVTRT